MTPRPTTDLPIEAIATELTAALDQGTSAVVVAPPGSGKTTVVPLMLLDQPWRRGRIVMLEPRRIATRAAARRLADLLGEPVGGRVGYVTRQDRVTHPAVDIEVVTEGVLTRRLQRDPSLAGTAAVLFDEVHERNLQTDLGLALLLDARSALRPDLRVVAMSATIDAERVAALLGAATPVLRAEGRLHPVEVRWEPPPRGRPDVAGHAATVIDRLIATEPGDVLAFLPGMREINQAARALRERDLPAAVHRLHGSLPVAEQDAALRPASGQRRVVLATDIAESSLTVEGVRIVVDGGRARAPRFDPRTGMTRLTTVSISKASADQRSGRAGRTAPGLTVRLWSKLEHGARAAHSAPEITSVDLAGLALELAAWGTPSPTQLRFLDAPPRRAWDEARKLLEALGAVGPAGDLTELGRAMAELPMHPRLARMVAGAGEDAGLAVVLAALVDERDIFRGPPDELPVDLLERVRVLDGAAHPAADRRGVDRARRTVAGLRRQLGIEGAVGHFERAGRLLATAFPDRLAVRRGSPGRFQLRTGTSAWLNQADPLAIEAFVVPVDLDGKRKDARIRLAAAIDPEDVAEVFAPEVDRQTELVWRGRRIVEQSTRRLGGISLDLTERRPDPSPTTARMVLDRVRKERLGSLRWSEAALQLRHRVAYLRRVAGEPWPDWSDAALLDDLAAWLGPVAATALSLDDVSGADVVKLLRRSLPPRGAAQLDRLAPRSVQVPSGRSIPVDYSSQEPRIAVAVQEMFGTAQGPTIGGRPIVIELLSPARRPVQITSDLAGFWAGSWHAVRKELAGRYPKHEWPEDPLSAAPVRM